MKMKVWSLVVITILLVAGLGVAQLQTSGGLVTAIQSGVWNIGTVTTVTAVTAITNALPTGSNVIGHIILDASSAVIGHVIVDSGATTLSAGSAVIGTVSQIPLSTCGTTVYDSGNTSVPSVTTSLTATNTCVMEMLFTNITSSNATLTVTDGQGSPQTYLASFVIPPNSIMPVVMNGMKMTSGIKWSGTLNAINGQVKGTQ